MVVGFFGAAVWIADEDETELRCPASRRALELILSLRGLVGLPAGGELCWECGATVTNVTADRLHKTANEKGKEDTGRRPSLCAEQSRSKEGWVGMDKLNSVSWIRAMA